MTPLIAIGLDAAVLLTIVCGVAGLLLSLGLLLFPERIRHLNALLSRSYNVKERLAYFDRPLPDTLFIYRHPLVYGALLAVGAVMVLIFLVFQIDTDRLLAALDLQGIHVLLGEMILEAMMLTGKIAGTIGLLLGLALMVAPHRLQRIETRLNTWIGTQSLVDRLDRYNDAFDGFVFRRPVLAGSIGLLLSVILILLSMLSFF
jgi:hypothetical protein